MIRLLSQVVAICVLSLLLVGGGQGLRSALENPPGIVPGQGTTTAAAGQPAAAADQLEFKGLDLSAYAETVSRPLFFDGRKYPVIAKPEPPPAPAVAQVPQPAPTRVSAEGIRLLGVMIRGSSAQALIEVPSQPAEWLAVGEKVQAWTVQAIKSDSVRLGSNTPSQFATLSLYDHVPAN